MLHAKKHNNTPNFSQIIPTSQLTREFDQPLYSIGLEYIIFSNSQILKFSLSLSLSSLNISYIKTLTFI